jgi:hypothetical protein
MIYSRSCGMCDQYGAKFALIVGGRVWVFD